MLHCTALHCTTQVEDDDSSSEVETLSDDDDEDEGAWLEPSHGGGNLPAAVRRRLVPTVSRVVEADAEVFGRFLFDA